MVLSDGPNTCMCSICNPFLHANKHSRSVISRFLCHFPPFPSESFAWSEFPCIQLAINYHSIIIVINTSETKLRLINVCFACLQLFSAFPDEEFLLFPIVLSFRQCKVLCGFVCFSATWLNFPSAAQPRGKALDAKSWGKHTDDRYKSIFLFLVVRGYLKINKRYDIILKRGRIQGLNSFKVRQQIQPSGRICLMNEA